MLVNTTPSIPFRMGCKSVRLITRSWFPQASLAIQVRPVRPWRRASVRTSMARELVQYRIITPISSRSFSSSIIVRIFSFPLWPLDGKYVSYAMQIPKGFECLRKNSIPDRPYASSTATAATYVQLKLRAISDMTLDWKRSGGTVRKNDG